MKDELRSRMKKQRRALSKEMRERFSTQIQEHVWPLLENAKSVMLYADNFGEVQTAPLAEKLLQKGIGVYYPRVLGEGQMEAVRIAALSELAPGAMGILEPVGNEIARDADVIILPGLAFSKAGARLGFGAGYYDRFLENSCGRFVALAYSFQVVDEIPVQPHDIPVHMIVTENGVHDCKEAQE